MARIQKVLLRMLFQLELLTLLNLERDFDTLAYKSEKGRERKREKERERKRERRKKERERRKKEERFGYRHIVTSRILNIIGAKNTS